jgi:exoribonuclease R
MKSKPIPYSDATIRQAVELNAKGVSFHALASAFEADENIQADLRLKLQALVDEGFAVRDTKSGHYHAKNPISDLVIARVASSLRGEQARIQLAPNTRIPLSIEGLPDDFPFHVSVNSKLLKKKFNRDYMYTGERLAVVLDRKGGTELNVTQIVGKFSANREPSIVGHFLANAEKPKFSAYAPGITTRFNAEGNVPEDINPKKSFFANVPSSLDPYNPVLRISEQKWDPDTGVSITAIIARKHGISSHHTKQAMIESKHAMNMPIPLDGRRDLTQEKILVIDPVDAKDNDDGILIERTRDGYRTLVVIADAPYYVRPGSELDKAAREKGFTHYLRDDTFYMLPEGLVKHASLTQGRSKPVIYVEQFWDLDFQPLPHMTEIGAGVISAQKQMTYGEFQDALKSRPNDMASYIEFGDNLVYKMRFEKVIFDLDDREHENSYAQMVVAGLMIEANTAIAEHLIQNNVPFLSRSHTGSDNLYAFAELKETLEQWGYDVPQHIAEMDSEALRQIIAQSEARNDKRRVETIIRNDFLNQARYSTIPYSHFGLNRENYTHGTSPVRRYCDILALRGVHATLQNHELALSDDDIEFMDKTAQHLNNKQEVSRRVVNDMNRYYAIRDIQRLEGHRIRATLKKVDEFRIEILLDDRFGLRQTVEVSKLPENWKLARNNKSLIYNDNIVFKPGDSLRVKLGNVRPHMGTWDIEEIEAPASRLKPAAPAERPIALTMRIP